MKDRITKRNLFAIEKEATLIKNSKLISKWQDNFDTHSNLKCDLQKDKILVCACETKEEKQKWTAFVHLTTSLPYKGAIGRQVKFFIYCGSVIIGMFHLVSPMAHMKLRDAYVGLNKNKNKWNILKGIYNIETCVPMKNYSHFLTGKLLVYTIFSKSVTNYMELKYHTKVIGFETTSLYGKAIMYDRIPFLKYLGLSDGYSAMYISDEEWKKIKNEYYTVYPNTKTNRLAPVKYQIVDKLQKYYKKINKEFPYEYINEDFKRGIYFGYTQNMLTTDEQINNWRNRWLIKRWVK